MILPAEFLAAPGFNFQPPAYVDTEGIDALLGFDRTQEQQKDPDPNPPQDPNSSEEEKRSPRPSRIRIPPKLFQSGQENDPGHCWINQ